MADPTVDDVPPLVRMIGAVSPVLLPYTQERIIGELWHRPDLLPRDRSIVTLAVLVSRNASVAYPNYFNKALDSGLEASEVSELLTHLAFYASWPYVFAALTVVRDIFAQRGINPAQLPETSPVLLSVEQALPDGSERAAFIEDNIGSASSALRHFTGTLLDHEVWLRPGLAPRDRALASVAVIAALGQLNILPFYLERAVLLGITKDEISEMLAHVAFYAGWGNAMEASRVVNRHFEEKTRI